MYGGIAGAVYKSTRGYRPMILAGVMGACISQGYHYMWSRGMFDLSRRSNEAGKHFGNVEISAHNK